MWTSGIAVELQGHLFESDKYLLINAKCMQENKSAESLVSYVLTGKLLMTKWLEQVSQ